MEQPAPIVVCPITWTWEISLQLAPILTSRPITQYGPTVAPSPITAPFSTRAVGSIVVIEGSVSLVKDRCKSSIFQWLARAAGTVQRPAIVGPGGFALQFMVRWTKAEPCVSTHR